MRREPRPLLHQVCKRPNERRNKPLAQAKPEEWAAQEVCAPWREPRRHFHSPADPNPTSGVAVAGTSNGPTDTGWTFRLMDLHELDQPIAMQWVDGPKVPV